MKEGKDLFVLPTRWGNLARGMLLAGVAAAGAGFYFNPTGAWISLLLNNFYFVGLALFGIFILAVGSVCSAAWVSPFKRVAQSMSAFLPAGALIMIVVGLFGGHSLYEWTHHDVVAGDPVLSAKAGYLNLPFFMVRMVICFSVWLAFSWILVRLSSLQDDTGDIALTGRIKGVSAVFLVLFALTFSVASFDWIMSIEPHWFSTIFAVYCFSGMFVAGAAALTFALIVLQQMGYLTEVIKRDHYHDLGKLLFAFSTFWAYIWISQYMLIWYSNIPEETTYFILRESGDWDWLFWFNLVLNWVVPFMVLMPRGAKRSSAALLRVSIVLLIGHWLDLYLMIAPKVFEHHGQHHPFIGPVELGISIGFAGAFILMGAAFLGRRALLGRKDPFLVEGLHFTQ